MIKILEYLPRPSFIQIAQVASRFHDAWIEMKRTQQSMQIQSAALTTNLATTTSEEFATNPMAFGNLFSTRWSFVPERNTGLNTTLLKYYIEN